MYFSVLSFQTPRIDIARPLAARAQHAKFNFDIDFGAIRGESKF